MNDAQLLALVLGGGTALVFAVAGIRAARLLVDRAAAVLAVTILLLATLIVVWLVR